MAVVGDVVRVLDEEDCVGAAGAGTVSIDVAGAAVSVVFAVGVVVGGYVWG